MKFCIPANLIDGLKKDVLAGANIANLYNLSPEARAEFFAKSTNPQLGRFIAGKFEEAMVSKNKKALQDFVISLKEPKVENGIHYRGIGDRIKTLQDLGAFGTKENEIIMTNLISERLGITATTEELAQMSKISNEIADAYNKANGKLGSVEHYQSTIDFFAGKVKMDNLILSINPTSNLKILTAITGRASMLFSAKSTVLNIGSNIELGAVEAVGRRVANLSFKSVGNVKQDLIRPVKAGTEIVNGEKVPVYDNKIVQRTLKEDYRKLVADVFDRTGYDISRMVTIRDNVTSGGRVLDDLVHVEGDNTNIDSAKVTKWLSKSNRSVARFYQDTVFKLMLGKPDQIASAIASADSLGLTSYKAAKEISPDSASEESIVALGNELMREAMIIDRQMDPIPSERDLIIEQIRNQAILDAQWATWTNDTWNSKLVIGIRKLLNDTTGDLRAGDYIMPFVKTPANVIAYGLDVAGLSALRAAKNTIVTINNNGFNGLKDAMYLRKMSRDLTRMGLGMALAILIASNLDDDDFMGAYDPARYQIDKLANANYNAIRIGGYWISTDWLGPVAIPVTAIMYSRKYSNSKTVGEHLFQYAKGATTQFFQTPGIKDAIDAAQKNNPKGLTLDQALSQTGNYITESVYSRLVPSLSGDIAKAIDTGPERENKKGIQGIQGKVPFWRNSLPPAKNIFGEEIPAGNFVSDMILGARIKMSQETQITKEIQRVQKENNKTFNFTDWSKSNTKILNQFKDKVGDEKFKQATDEYGAELRKQIDELINSDKYKKLNDQEKYDRIIKMDSEAQDVIFKKYHFKYKQEKTSLIKPSSDIMKVAELHSMVKDLVKKNNEPIEVDINLV